MPQQHAVSSTTPAPRLSVELFSIRVDYRVDHFTTYEALPAGEGERRASRILQRDGHHQTMTTKAVHEVAPGLEISAHPPVLPYTHGVVLLRQVDSLRPDKHAWCWSGGDWRIGRARKDQETREMEQPAELHTNEFTLGALSAVVKQYNAVLNRSADDA